jgi:hypothetical protein
MDVHGAPQSCIGRIRVNRIDDRMDRLVAARAEDRGTEDPVRSASTRTFMKPSISPFSTARPTRVIGL